MSSEMSKNEHIAAILAAGLLANPSRDLFLEGAPAGVATTLYTNIVIQLGNQDLQLSNLMKKT